MARKSTSGDMSKAPHWRPDRPYNDLPRLPPATELETKAVLKQCVAARSTLAELKKAAELFPNPAMLINTLPLLEARASSEIENIVTTADKLFRHLQADAGADPSRADELLTNTLKQALLLVDVQTLDHFIIASTKTLGFAERGLL